MCKVLHIEDSSLQKTLVRMIFDKSEWDTFHVVHVSSMKEALSQLANKSFDIVIADLNLPDSGRTETVPTLKKANPDIPIIAISSEDDFSIAMQSIRDGVDCFINKSWELKQLPWVVLAILEKRKMSQEFKISLMRAATTEMASVSRELDAKMDSAIAMAKETSRKLEILKEQGREYGGFR